MTDAESFFESCTASALRLVTELNKRGINAIVKMDDTQLHLNIPAYDKREATSKSVRIDVSQDQCAEFLQPLHEALQYFVEAEVREKELMTVLDKLPYDALKLMADEPEIHTLVQTAVLRRLTSHGHVSF